jgi:maleylpyruvate isomerase
MSETLEQARTRLRQRLGSGARFDSAAAPMAELLAMRLARAACLRQVSRLGDDALELPPLAGRVAELGCTARRVAEAFEAASGHDGIEGDDAGRVTGLAAEISLARTLPGRALRSLYLHAMQHLDVACRDLDAAGWSARLAMPGLAPATPQQALALMTALLKAGAAAFETYADHGQLPLAQFQAFEQSGVPS